MDDYFVIMLYQHQNIPLHGISSTHLRTHGIHVLKRL